MDSHRNTLCSYHLIFHDDNLQLLFVNRLGKFSIQRIPDCRWDLDKGLTNMTTISCRASLMRVSHPVPGSLAHSTTTGLQFSCYIHSQWLTEYELALPTRLFLKWNTIGLAHTIFTSPADSGKCTVGVSALLVWPNCLSYIKLYNI